MHPLRQTSFPISADTDPRVYVKSEPEGSVTGSFTGSLAESFDGFGGKGRKRKGKGQGQGQGHEKKKGDGDGDGSGSGSVKGGKRRGGGGGGGSSKGGTGGSKAGAGGDEDGEGDEDDEYMDDAEMLAGEGGGPAMDAKAEKENLAYVITLCQFCVFFFGCCCCCCSGFETNVDSGTVSVLIDAFDTDQSTRYDLFKRAKLSKPALRKIVNQTLSQSVPPNVVTTVSGYSKIFIGEIVEKARTVQDEWANAADEAAIAAAQEVERKAAEGKTTATKPSTPAATPTTAPAPATATNTNANTPTNTNINTTTIKSEESDGVAVKIEDSQPSLPSTQTAVEGTPPVQSPNININTNTNTNPPTTNTPAATSLNDAEKPPLKLPPNPHRGPLLPAHIREALRRYKRAGEGGNVGFSGLSMKGLGVKGSSSWNINGAGGRRLFR